MKKMTQDYKLTELAKIRALLLKADYKGAKSIAEKLRDKISGDFEIDFTYAKILGDYADELPLPKRLELKKAASKILGRLICRMNGQAEEIRIGVRINYYYQTRKFSGLEKVGKELQSSNQVRGLYAAGVGASLEAERIFRGSQKMPVNGVKAARRSIVYWKQYFTLKKGETYYFPYSLLAMSEAILGNEKEMEKALTKAQNLSGKKKNFWEFREVRELLKESRLRSA